MGEDKNDYLGDLNKLALIVEAMEDLVPKSQIGVYIELDEESFSYKKKTLLKSTDDVDKFSIKISGVEFLFILSPGE